MRGSSCAGHQCADSCLEHMGAAANTAAEEVRPHAAEVWQCPASKTPEQAPLRVVPRKEEPQPQPHAPQICRICLEEVDGGEFVRPCPCRGTTGPVHLSCLKQHFLAQGDWHNFRCPTCKQYYEGHALRELAELSRDAMTALHGEGSPQVAQSLCYLAQAHSQLGNARESKELIQRALAMTEAHVGRGHWATAAILAELASAHGKLGDVQTQKELLEQSLEIKEKHFGRGHINTAVTLNNLATAYSEMGDIQKEKDLLERSLEIKERHFGKGHVQTTAALVNLAGVYNELGDVPMGRQLLETSLAIEERHFGAGHVETAITINNLALACGEGGDLTRMCELLTRSLSIKEAHFGSEHQELCLTLANLAMAYAALGEDAPARAFSVRALGACCHGEAVYAGSRRHGVVLLRVASVHLALGEELQAFQYVRRAALILIEALGFVAKERVLNLESARMLRIWQAAGRGEVVRQLYQGRCLDGPAEKAEPDAEDPSETI